MLATKYDSLWNIGAVDIYGQTINRLGDLVTNKKCVMVVNIATLDHDAAMNFAGLAELYSKYKDQGFEILAFPCNQFNKKEPLTNEHILSYIKD